MVQMTRGSGFRVDFPKLAVSEHSSRGKGLSDKCETIRVRGASTDFGLSLRLNKNNVYLKISKWFVVSKDDSAPGFPVYGRPVYAHIHNVPSITQSKIYWNYSYSTMAIFNKYCFLSFTAINSK